MDKIRNLDTDNRIFIEIESTLNALKSKLAREDILQKKTDIIRYMKLIKPIIKDKATKTAPLYNYVLKKLNKIYQG